jgi:hypothetical protein
MMGRTFSFYLLFLLVVCFRNAFCLNEYNYGDNRAASANPPGGLNAQNVPQFVTLGFDDNAASGWAGSQDTGGMLWIMNYLKTKTNPGGTNAKTYDKTPCKVTFYCLSYNVSVGAAESQTYVKWGWHQALVDSNELGNHSQTHGTSAGTTLSGWETEMNTCNSWLFKPYDQNEDPDNPDNSKGAGAMVHDIFGWRTPSLEYNDYTFTALKALGFWYDCSIENSWNGDEDGTTLLWPYTLDSGTPDDQSVTSHPGLWEIPVHVIIVPPALRAQIKKKAGPGFDSADGRVTGLDYNMWGYASVDGLAMNKTEFAATLKYTLDQHLAGNRAPMTFGCHSDIYASSSELFPNATYQERQQAIQEFIDYALTKPQVRIVTVKHILDWCRNPAPLAATGIASPAAGGREEKAVGIDAVWPVKSGITVTLSAPLPGNARATMELFSANGTRIAHAALGQAGSKTIVWKVNGLGNGVYLVKINADGTWKCRRVILNN